MNVSSTLLRLALLSSVLLIASCQTKPVVIQTTVSAECKTIPPLSYAWPPHCEFGKPCPDSAGNAYDTETTAKAIMADNAAKAALCPKEGQS